MRIVIDLQGCQANRLKAASYDLLFAREIARHPRGHEIHIVLNGGFPEAVEGLRKAFDSSLPQERIHVWETPQPVAEQNPANAWRARAGEWVREAFIASLKPDAIYIADLFGGFHDNAISSVGLWENSALCAVTLPASLDAEPDPASIAWFTQKKEQLRKAHLWFARSEPAREKAMEAGLPSADILLLPADLGEAAELVLTAFEKRHRDFSAPSIQPSQPSRKLRLAYLSPLPPEHTGIASYSAELLPELAKHYDIEVIVHQQEVSDVWIRTHLPVRTWHWFDRNAARYDRILYHIGNSPFHTHMFELLERHPGVVILHDFFLGDALFSIQQGHRPFYEAFYASHGYNVLQNKGSNAEIKQLIRTFPANWNILNNADGIITHSAFGQKLAEQFYGNKINQQWAQIPHLRCMPTNIDRHEARKRLGFSDDDFVVCTFGFLNATKCCDILLDTWQTSPLASNPQCHLVFAGENALGKTFSKKITSSRIEITGFLQKETYADYLMAADVAVQLRRNSRGETSGTVLDCLAHGLPTVVNFNGTFAELPKEVVFGLPDSFTQEDLQKALISLYEDRDLRVKLSKKSADYIRDAHNPTQVANRLFNAIEEFHTASLFASTRRLSEGITQSTLLHQATEKDWTRLGQAIANNQAAFRPRLPKFFLNISAIVHTDLKTGIERVTRSLLLELINTPSGNYRVEPVYLAGDGQYRYARRFMQKFMGIGECGLLDEVAIPDPGDIFFTIDLNFDAIKKSKEHLQHWRNKGVKMYFIVYDLLPILFPAYFPSDAEGRFRGWITTVCDVSDGLLCISKSVADEVRNWISATNVPLRRPLNLGYFHLGANIQASKPTSGIDPSIEPLLETISKAPTFLMVGTVEPRKGHAQALAAFEHLWKNGVAVNLVIVGKEGWQVGELADKMRSHPQAGKALFWFEKASDEMLLKLYQSTSALLYPSEGEGFGLPLIEAAQHGLPIVARDLPVFREVAGDHAFYFSGMAPEDLATGLRQWLNLFAEGKAPTSKGMPFQTWKDAARQIKSMILENVWYTSVRWDAESACSPARER